MTKYNSEYYIALKAAPDMQYITIKPNDQTSDRLFNTVRPSSASAPFFFENQNREKDKERGISRKITDVFARGSIGWLVSDDVHNKIKGFVIPGLGFHPAVYVDDAGEWHENYWFIGFYDQLDCYDRKLSEYKGDPARPLSVSVRRYHLDADVLDLMPVESRLMFMMGGEGSNEVFCHQKIVDLFEENKFGGVRFVKVADFHQRLQFMDRHPNFVQF